MLFSDALKLYARNSAFTQKAVTVERNNNDLRQLCLLLGNPRLVDITYEHILKHMELMLELGWTKNGIYKKAMVYKSFFKFLKVHGYYSVDPDKIPKMRLEFRPPRIAHETEYKKLLRIIPGNHIFHIRNNAIVRLLWDTGMRVGELTSLNLDDLDPEPKKVKKSTFYTARIKTEKSRGKRPMRQIFWTKETNEHLQKWLLKREEYMQKYTFVDPEALFIGTTNNQFGKRLSISAVDIALRKYSTKAKIPTMNAHSFRHGKARRVVEMGGTNADVMNILGHSDLNSSKIYTVLFGQDLVERAEKFL